MNSRYPEDSNIIDFVEIKLQQLFEEYSALRKQDEAVALWKALDEYVSGTIDIIFKHGEPYIINRENKDTDIIHEDDLT